MPQHKRVPRREEKKRKKQPGEGRQERTLSPEERARQKKRMEQIIQRKKEKAKGANWREDPRFKKVSGKIASKNNEQNKADKRFRKGDRKFTKRKLARKKGIFDTGNFLGEIVLAGKQFNRLQNLKGAWGSSLIDNPSRELLQKRAKILEEIRKLPMWQDILWRAESALLKSYEEMRGERVWVPKEERVNSIQEYYRVNLQGWRDMGDRFLVDAMTHMALRELRPKIEKMRI